ncbi:hypothetical protein OHT52_16410 [Streptomyces sp. NBC_00247]|uniref:hypothetical protein n=1 Tax=Streptomyces sp. NBC_00247 TaxID=2975689 RepID=UPI002E2D77CB|nr:hypothetical protein [Streptomyces sp. NBC_00247]
MPRLLRVMADYGCHPLWIPDVPDNVSPHDPAFGLTAGLARKLEAWSDEFEAILVMDDPASSAFPSVEAEVAFCRTGEELARQVAAELGAAWRVTYLDVCTGSHRDVLPAAGPPRGGRRARAVS